MNTEHGPDTQLGIYHEEFPPEWLPFLKARSIRQIYLPTETVIHHPGQSCMQASARVYDTGLHTYNGYVWTYDELLAWHRVSDKAFPGSVHFPAVSLVELWENYGSDGHIDYELVAWALMTEEQILQAYPKYDERTRRGYVRAGW